MRTLVLSSDELLALLWVANGDSLWRHTFAGCRVGMIHHPNCVTRVPLQVIDGLLRRGLIYPVEYERTSIRYELTVLGRSWAYGQLKESPGM